MGFFKTRAASFGQHGGRLNTSSSGSQQQQWLQQQGQVDAGRLRDLQDLAQRMQRLQSDMEQMTHSMQGRRASMPSPEAFAATPAPNAAGPTTDFTGLPGMQINSSLEPHPNLLSAAAAAREAVIPPSQPGSWHGPSVPSANMAADVNLEQILSDGRQSRARVNSSSPGPHQASQVASGMPVPGNASMPHSNYTHQPYSMGQIPMPPGPSHQSAMSGLPHANAPGMHAGPWPGPADALPGAAPYQMPANGPVPVTPDFEANAAFHGPHGGLGQQTPFNAASAIPRSYEFPDPFKLRFGPHRPGFGNGFTMQERATVMGQMSQMSQMGINAMPGMGGAQMHTGMSAPHPPGMPFAHV